MHYQDLHSWDLTPAEAIELQKQLQHRVRIEPLAQRIETIAGCDISFERFSDVAYAGIVVLRLPSLEPVEYATAVTRVGFPYIPGLLSFRETPALLRAWQQLGTRPDAVMLDGQGLAHPRRFGIACHFGVITDRPSAGCAKSVLVGRYGELGDDPGSHAMLTDRGEIVGAAVRTKSRVAPVYVSVGHLIDLPGAIDLTLRSVKGYEVGAPADLFGSAPPPRSRYRIPEPTRLAHLLVNALRRGESLDAALTDARSSG